MIGFGPEIKAQNGIQKQREASAVCDERRRGRRKNME